MSEDEKIERAVARAQARIFAEPRQRKQRECAAGLGRYANGRCKPKPRAPKKRQCASGIRMNGKCVPRALTAEQKKKRNAAAAARRRRKTV